MLQASLLSLGKILLPRGDTFLRDWVFWLLLVSGDLFLQQSHPWLLEQSPEWLGAGVPVILSPGSAYMGLRFPLGEKMVRYQRGPEVVIGPSRLHAQSQPSVPVLGPLSWCGGGLCPLHIPAQILLLLHALTWLPLHVSQTVQLNTPHTHGMQRGRAALGDCSERGLNGQKSCVGPGFQPSYHLCFLRSMRR